MVAQVVPQQVPVPPSAAQGRPAVAVVQVGATQVPLRQASPAPHALPHAPQFESLELVSTQPAPAQHSDDVPASGLQ